MARAIRRGQEHCGRCHADMQSSNPRVAPAPIRRASGLLEQTVERERRITSVLKSTVTGRRHVNRIVRRG